MLELDSTQGLARLDAALGVRRWRDDVVAGQPYSSVAALVDAVERTGALTDAELDEAVSHHPRIGETPQGDDASARLSAAEQAGLGASAEGSEAAIARGNRVYEERFGRVFLIRAAGRSRDEILEELQRRLKNDPQVEAEEAKEQLREIAALRIATTFGDEG